METVKQAILDNSDFQMSEMEVYGVGKDPVRISKRE